MELGTGWGGHEGEGEFTKGHKETFGMADMFVITIVMMGPWAHVYVKALLIQAVYHLPMTSPKK